MRKTGGPPPLVAARLASLGLSLLLGACAGGMGRLLPGLTGEPAFDPANLKWSAYLTGSDLTSGCQEGGPNRMRLVYTLPGGGFRILELQDRNGRDENETSAEAVRWTVTPADLARKGPGEDWPAQGQRTRLSPSEVESVFAGLDAVGAFLPPDPQEHLSPSSKGFLLAACSGGASMVTVRFKPGDGGVPIAFTGSGT